MRRHTARDALPGELPVGVALASGGLGTAAVAATALIRGATRTLRRR